MTIAAHNGRCPTCGYDSDEIERAISDAYDIGVSDTVDAEQRALPSGSVYDDITFFREIAEQLNRWADESRTGGWSTHQVKPQRELAEKIYAHLGKKHCTHD
ncbi:MAG: hypothetical protein AB2792_19900 [Candidatus Thiodiazotropha sp.]